MNNPMNESLRQDPPDVHRVMYADPLDYEGLLQIKKELNMNTVTQWLNQHILQKSL